VDFVVEFEDGRVLATSRPSLPLTRRAWNPGPGRALLSLGSCTSAKSVSSTHSNCGSCGLKSRRIVDDSEHESCQNSDAVLRF
jgi:hypothetical protein